MSASSQMMLRKAITTATLDGGGRLAPEQANAFIDLTVNESKLLSMVRTVRKDNPKGEIDRIEFGSPVTSAAAENTDSGLTSEPSHSKIEFSTNKMRSAIDISTETFEENIEKQGYRTTVMTSLAKRIANDYEMLSIQGDTVKYAAGSTATEKLLKIDNGWFKQGLSGHTIDCGGATISRTIFSKMFKSLPNKYKQNRSALRFFCSPSIVQDYRDMLASRPTTLGDQSLQGAGPLTVFGIPIEEISLIPENLDSLNGSESWGDASFCWLTFPDNLIYVISRDMEIYWQFWPRKDAWESTIYTKTDSIIENTDAIVTAYNVRINADSDLWPN